MKHGCGFLLWPTDVRLPNGWPYGYDVAHTRGGRNVANEFVNLMKAEGLDVGFYYDLRTNFYLNVRNHQAHASDHILPGQHNVTQSEFENIALTHIKELWSQYGNLSEIWFDGGYTSDVKADIKRLVKKYQPNAAVFNGYGISKNPLCWVGIESGKPPSNGIWSTGRHDGTGNKYGPIFCPKVVDTTLQNNDRWFYSPGVGIRTMEDLVDVYHSSVGNNGVLELDFAINRDGLVEPNHADRYRELGAWIRRCYGNPISIVSGKRGQTLIELKVPKNKQIDRIMLQEDMSSGQIIRSFEIYQYSRNGQKWSKLYENDSGIGNKKIILLKKVSNSTKLMLKISKYAVSKFGAVTFSIYDGKKCIIT